MIENLAYDARHALRALRRRPGFALISVLSLALGLGATATMFGVEDATDLRPLPYRDTDGIVAVQLRAPADLQSCPGCRQPLPPALVRQVERLAVFQAVAAEHWFALAPAGGAELSFSRASEVGPEYFQLLGVAPAAGRVVQAQDTAAAAEPVVVLSDLFWHQAFGGDRSVVGRVVQLAGDGGAAASYRVIGIMPPRFDMLSNTALWVSRDATGPRPVIGARWVLARLAPGATRRQGDAELRAVLRHVSEQDPSLRGYSIRLGSLREEERFTLGLDEKRFVLLATAALVLGLAATNVAGLFLARLVSKEHELATRSALGATAPRLVRQLVMEMLVVGIIGGVGGIVLARWGLILIEHAPWMQYASLQLQIDGRLVAFAVLLTVASGAVIGSLPALAVVRRDLHARLRAGAAQLGGVHGGAMRSAIIVVQVAGAMLLASTAALLAREYLRLERMPLGLDPHGLLMVTFPSDIQRSGARPHGGADTLRTRVAEDIRGLAAVPGVAFASAEGVVGGRTYLADGRATPLRRDQLAGEAPVTIDYFRTLRKRVVAGRAFGPHDGHGAEPVGIVNETAARRLWPGESPLGRHIVVADSSGSREVVAIVGVARDTRLSRTSDNMQFPVLYRPYDQVPSAFRMYWLRTDVAPAMVVPALRREVQSLRPGASLVRGFSVQVAAENLDEEIATPRIDAITLTAFAAFALMLAAMGIFGLVSYAVRRSTRELGIRMALGASAADLLRAVAGSTAILGAVGVACGLGVTVAATRVLRSMLPGARPADPLVLAGSSVLLMLVIAVASYWPAREALRADPAAALRAE